MEKAVVLMLDKSHEPEYGEYVNTPVYNADGDHIGHTGMELPESGYDCEYRVLDNEGFASCASFSQILRLKKENKELRDLVESMYDDLSHQTFPPDWLPDYKKEMRELGFEDD